MERSNDHDQQPDTPRHGLRQRAGKFLRQAVASAAQPAAWLHIEVPPRVAEFLHQAGAQMPMADQESVAPQFPVSRPDVPPAVQQQPEAPQGFVEPPSEQ